jgi:hypothetical protein
MEDGTRSGNLYAGVNAIHDCPIATRVNGGISEKGSATRERRRGERRGELRRVF